MAIEKIQKETSEAPSAYDLFVSPVAIPSIALIGTLLFIDPESNMSHLLTYIDERKTQPIMTVTISPEVALLRFRYTRYSPSDVR